MAFLSEAPLETALLAQFAGLGYACATDQLNGSDGRQPERDAYDEVVLRARLTDLQDAAVQTELQQAEVLSALWQPGHTRS